MGQHAFSGNFSMTTQANYNALMGFVRASILADGWTLSTDTGQTDPTSAALPAANTDTVHEIYKSPTGLTPIYQRISYQRDASNTPQLVVQVGTGTNGTGTLTGVTSTSRTLASQSTPAAGHAYVSASDGWLTIAMDINNGALGLVYVLDRSVDATGVYTSTYFTTICYINGLNCPQETLVIAGGVQTGVQTGVVAPTLKNGGSWVFGTNILVPFMLPVVPTGAAQHSPNVGLWTSAAADFVADTVTQVSVYGAARSYIVCASANIAGGTGQFKGMVRYE